MQQDGKIIWMKARFFTGLAILERLLRDLHCFRRSRQSEKELDDVKRGDGSELQGAPKAGLDGAPEQRGKQS